MVKRHRALWAGVRKLILEHYDVLEDEFIRDAWYIIGDFLGILLKQGEVSQENYDWYNTKQGYATLRDDIWPFMEQQHGLTRPKAWPVGVIFDDGIEKPLSKLIEDMELGLTYIWKQARGFIFVEKGGVAKKLQPLSKYGWTICAGKGYPERLMRKILKEEDKQRPVLVLHDWDRDGEGIYEALGLPTRRTKHLDIALGDRVVNLGLTEEHVKALNIPTRPSPPKYKGVKRVELSGLSVLKTRLGIENPILSYTVTAMAAQGLTLSPTELEKTTLAQQHIRWLLTEGLAPVVNEAIKFIMKEAELEGSAVEAVLVKTIYNVPGLREKLIEVGMQFLDKIEWRAEQDFHEKALETFVDERLLKSLRGD